MEHNRQVCWIRLWGFIGAMAGGTDIGQDYAFRMYFQACQALESTRVAQ